MIIKMPMAPVTREGISRVLDWPWRCRNRDIAPVLSQKTGPRIKR